MKCIQCGGKTIVTDVRPRETDPPHIYRRHKCITCNWKVTTREYTDDDIERMFIKKLKSSKGDVLIRELQAILHRWINS
jgi:transcriptional regulator NrdR family protein